MNKFIKTYFQSFKLKDKFWKTLFLDTFFFGFIFLIFYFFSNYLNDKATILTQGLPTDYFANASPEELLPYLTQIKSFLLSAIIGIAILLIVSFLVYSLSRALIWDYLAKKKLTRKKFWNWNILNLALIFPLLGLGIGAIILKVITVRLINFLFTSNLSFYLAHQDVMQNIEKFLNDGISFLILIFIITFLFLTYSAFVQRQKVWLSIGNAFNSIKINHKKLSLMYLFALLTAILLSLILIPVQKALFLQSSTWTLITLAITLLYLAWYRFYFLRMIHGHQ